MNGISTVNNTSYNHNKLVNNPPFITNFPLIMPIENQKGEFIKNEHEFLSKEYKVEKMTNGVIWTGVLAVAFGICLAGRYAYKKTQNITNKIKAAIKSS